MLGQASQSAGIESLLFLVLPLLLCCIISSFFRGGFGGRGPSPTATLEVDSWFLPKDIRSAFDEVSDEVRKWREELMGPHTTKKVRERYQILQSIPPRLYSLFDEKEGEVTFELTEVEGGGTMVRVKYSPMARQRIRLLRAQSDAKIPATLAFSHSP